jgi:hypothetical protein
MATVKVQEVEKLVYLHQMPEIKVDQLKGQGFRANLKVNALIAPLI